MLRMLRFREERIIGVLSEHQAAMGVRKLRRKHAIRDGTFYKWRSKDGGMGGSEAKQLTPQEAENATPMKMLAEQMLDVATFKEMPGKNF